VTESFYVSSVLNAIPATAGAVNSTYIANGAVGSTQLATGGVAQSNLGTNVAGNGPAFSAYTSTPQSITNGSFTLLQLDGKEFDTASCYNGTGSTVNGIPAYAFKPTVAGYYQFNAQAYLAAGSQTELALQLYKNGSGTRYVGDAINPASRMVNGSILYYMNGSTDYIQVYLYTSTTGSTGSVTTCWSASLMRAA